MNRPLPPPLHDRLTVVRAENGADAVDLANRLAAALLHHDSAAGVAVDLRHGPRAVPVVGADEVHQAAVERATLAFERRAAARDEAIAHRSELAARRTHLLERAEWCEATAGTARALTASVASAEATVAQAGAELEAAATRRDRVAEQRAAAQAAVEEARLELEGLDGAALDETGVRRELEAATRVEREAADALAAADAEVASLRDRLQVLDAQQAELAAARDALAEAVSGGGVPDGADDAVVDALAFYDELAERAGPDPGAAALADALGRVEAEITARRGALSDPPTDADLDAVEADIAALRRQLDAIRASASSFDGPPPPWWSELNALHAAVVDAEMALQGGGLRKGGARKRYEEAYAAERARLDELGFDSHLDALMSGGRLPSERSHDDRAIREATEALAAAERRAEHMRAARREALPLIEQLAERERLLEVAAGLLGCDPGSRALELLAAHPAVPPMAISDLADALRFAGVPTTGIAVAAAARAWLDARAAQLDPTRLEAAERRLAEVVAERHVVEHALEPATARAERAAAAATAAARTVASLEAELRARAGDDGRLFERATAARALREQVEAVERRLADAEAEAMQAWALAAEVVSNADAERERFERDLADLGRRATRAAAELPVERRPAFDLVAGLVPLAGALRAEATLVADELAIAEATVAATEVTAGFGSGAPTPDDVADGLVAAVLAAATGPAGAIVLAEPLQGIAAEVAELALTSLAEATGEHPTVVVTTDMAVVGWAIGLPSDVGVMVPARAVSGLVAAAPSPAPAPETAPVTTNPVD